MMRSPNAQVWLAALAAIGLVVAGAVIRMSLYEKYFVEATPAPVPSEYRSCDLAVDAVVTALEADGSVTSPVWRARQVYDCVAGGLRHE